MPYRARKGKSVPVLLSGPLLLWRRQLWITYRARRATIFFSSLSAVQRVRVAKRNNKNKSHRLLFRKEFARLLFHMHCTYKVK